MKLTEQKAIEIDKKVMEEIGFTYDKEDLISAVVDEGKVMFIGVNIWIISFMYGKEDYGRNVDANMIILDDTGMARSINMRNSAIDLGYKNGKYFIKERRP